MPDPIGDDESHQDGEEKDQPADRSRPEESLSNRIGEFIWHILFTTTSWIAWISIGSGIAWFNVTMLHHSVPVSILCFIVLPLAFKTLIHVKYRDDGWQDVGCLGGCTLTILFFTLLPIVIKLTYNKQHPYQHHRIHAPNSGRSITGP